MSDTHLKTISIDGAKIDVLVKENGNFTARYDGELFETSSLKSLQERLKKHIRTNRRIDIPVTLLEEDYHDKLVVKQVRLMGMQSRTGNILYKEEKTGETHQDRGYHNSFYRRMTPEEIQQLFSLRAAVRAAKEALDAFMESRQVHTKVLIEEAMKHVDPETADIPVGSEVRSRYED